MKNLKRFNLLPQFTFRQVNVLLFRDVVELLVRNDARLDIGANTPLMEAAQEGHLDTVRFILNEMRAVGLSVSIFLLA